MRKKSNPPTARVAPAEKSAIDAQLRIKVKASLADPRKSVPASDVFKRLRALHAAVSSGRPPYSSR
jgi:hypothetical protein